MQPFISRTPEETIKHLQLIVDRQGKALQMHETQIGNLTKAVDDLNHRLLELTGK